MVLKDVHDTLDEIPENYRELYTEKNGKFELTGIQGIKTSADVARIQTSLEKERTDHKETKGKLKVWGDMSHEDVVSKLDRMEELEAAAADKLDEAKIEELVTKRVDGVLKSKTSPLERQINQLSTERDELRSTNEKFVMADRQRKVHDNVRKALTEAKVISEAHEDALLLANSVFEVTDDGAVLTREGSSVTPGLDATGWLAEIQEKRPHWWPGSVGGGSRGTGAAAGIGAGGNPFSHDGWNLTQQGQVLREHGVEKAAALAKAAGTTVGGTRPPAKK